MKNTIHASAAAALMFSCVYLPTNCQAEMISLGPFKPKFIIFKTVIEPAIEVMVDATTTQLATRFQTDSRTTIDVATLSGYVKDIAERHLPIDVAANPCTFTIERLTDFHIAVSGYTGDLRATMNVTPHGCPLNRGNVTVAMRFIPAATKTDLTVKIVQIRPTVPWWWETLGAILRKKPEELIEVQIREFVSTIRL